MKILKCMKITVKQKMWHPIKTLLKKNRLQRDKITKFMAIKGDKENLEPPCVCTTLLERARWNSEYVCSVLRDDACLVL